MCHCGVELLFELVDDHKPAAFRNCVPHTDPNSVVKTRMQSLEAKKQYKNAFHCAYRIFTEEGILSFWKGTVPRLGRLVVSRALLWASLLSAGTRSPPRCLVVSSSQCTRRSTPLRPRFSLRLHALSLSRSSRPPRAFFLLVRPGASS